MRSVLLASPERGFPYDGSMSPLQYPTPPTAEQIDDLHGTSVADPFRPLEDVDAPATRAWIEAENRLTESVLAAAPARAPLRTRLTELWNFPRAGAPWRRGGHWFQLRNTGLQNQDVLWTASTPDGIGPDGEGRVLVDPNARNAAGTTTLSGIVASPRGTYVALGVSDAGSDWRTWEVIRTADGTTLPDRITWSKFASVAWTADEAGFVYGRYPAPADGDTYEAANLGMELRYHRLGTSQAEDPLVHAAPEHPEWVFDVETADEGRLLVVTVGRGTDPETRIHVADLQDGIDAAVVRPLLDRADATYLHVATVDGTLYVRTTAGAPLGRLIAIPADSAADDATAVREVVAEGADTLESALLVGGRLALLHLHHAHHRLSIVDLDGCPAGEVALPGIGSVMAAAGEPDDPEVYLSFADFRAPACLFAVTMASGDVRLVRRPALSWNPDDFVAEQVFVPSGDGSVLVPLFLVRRGDVTPTGDVPTLLYGYGGFNIAIGPMFKAEWLAWMERGGLLAVACLRGGGEYGQTWHDDGRLANKQHVFDDHAACLRWLAASGWTRADRIGVTGRSNGGLLVGAALTQHPELFGAAVPEVGVLDMLRFHLFTIGWAWTSDYGSADDPEQLRWLLGYSPLHNVRPGTAYPPTLVTTGDHDDRVVPGHSFKFAAALQAAQAGEDPVLIRIDTDAGHGAGKPIAKLIDERADVLAFLERALDA